jgi:hypothetical protein
MRAVFFIFAMVAFMSYGQELVVNGGSDVLPKGVSSYVEVVGDNKDGIMLDSYTAKITKVNGAYIVTPNAGETRVAIGMSFIENGELRHLGYYVYEVK